ncbi:hypothetical protein DAPPUDRAFT_268250 [Daphnia pulex]|uniref:Uncharacterized protein n=1 Tax=Daphnia pulex TaxID=6669 RepID=E9HXH5_DAPPU|nr:hypothetical protein DAPPUDRAFT_268250 [Daphnia pulex]|eukprot:EFX63547.1 hypothetical protein DAPPUDRAFT_268250 [Daphnia pulex]
MKRRYLRDQQRQKELMEEYLVENEPRQNARKRRNSEDDDSDSDVDEDEQIKELNNGLLGTADGRILVPQSIRGTSGSKENDSKNTKKI